MPASATHQWINLAGVAGLVLASLAAIAFRLNPLAAALLCMAAYAVPVAVLELLLLKVHRRASTGLDWAGAAGRPVAWGRVGVKLLGLLGSVAAVVAGHWLLRLYDPADMQVAAAGGLAVAIPGALVVVAYVAAVDRAMVDPRDGYWDTGCLLLGRMAQIDRARLRSHALGWTVKGFFLPIMFVYLVKQFARLQATLDGFDAGYMMAVQWLSGYAVALELGIVCVGYFCTFRAIDAHIRSPNPFLAAWVVTLACYAPFNSVVSGGVLRFEDGLHWQDWFSDLPIIGIPWAAALLASFAMWVWATAAYGLRWSNLTNRGIITDGPYRYTKHPDYIAKSIFFWLVHVPFLSAAGPADALRNTALLILLNLIYYGRAKTEERHLSQDPVYVAYALAMNERSIFRWTAAVFPGLRYRAAAAS